ncbi:MAG: hypothetical protein KIS85_02745 [Anaerolineales bacterium]|nr:hypothetical protein [Anaerolineales bacterium]
MSFRSFVIAILFLSIFYMGLSTAMDTDTWWHLRTGEVIVQTGAIPKTDSFSFTRAGHPWHYPSMAWLSQLQLYAVYTHLGFGGLNLWTAVMITLAFTFIYKALSGPPLLRAFMLVPAVTASGVYWAARPYMVTFVLTAAFLWILEDYRWGRTKRLIWLPLLMVLWANSHPGFTIGFLVWGAYFAAELIPWAAARLRRQPAAEAGRRTSQLALAGLGMLLAACINPAGPAVLGYTLETLSIGVLRDHIVEWQSPNFHWPSTQPFALLLLFSIGIVGASRIGLGFSDFFLLVGFGYLGLLAGRNIPAFALAAPLVLERHVQAILAQLADRFGWKPGQPLAASWIRWLHVAVVLLGLLVILVQARTHFDEEARAEYLAARYPVGAVEYLRREQPPGRLLNSYNWGGYLIWNLREYPVFTDGRTDLYGDELLEDWLALSQAQPGWPEVLERHEIDLILLEKTRRVVLALPFHGWQTLYEDEHSVLYGRAAQAE